jgi:hypothetical protein
VANERMQRSTKGMPEVREGMQRTIKRMQGAIKEGEKQLKRCNEKQNDASSK